MVFAERGPLNGNVSHTSHSSGVCKDLFMRTMTLLWVAVSLCLGSVGCVGSMEKYYDGVKYLSENDNSVWFM